MTVNRRRRSWAERVERDLARADRAANLAARKASTIDADPVIRYFGCDLCGAIFTMARRSEVEAHRASHMA